MEETGSTRLSRSIMTAQTRSNKIAFPLLLSQPETKHPKANSIKQ